MAAKRIRKAAKRSRKAKDVIRYRIGKRYVTSPNNRMVEAVLFHGKSKVILGEVKSIAAAQALHIKRQLTVVGLPAKDIHTRRRRWDAAAVDLAKRAIKAGLKKGDRYEIWTGKEKAQIFNSHGRATLRSIASRKKTGSKSLAEEITREMFRLARLRLSTAKLSSEQVEQFDLSSFHIKLTGHKSKVGKREAQISKAEIDRALARFDKEFRHLTRKTMAQATRSSAASRSGKKRKMHPKAKRKLRGRKK